MSLQTPAQPQIPMKKSESKILSDWQRWSIFSVLMLAAFVFASGSADGHSLHSKNICAVKQPGLCAHVGYNSQPNTKAPSEFMLHFMLGAGIDDSKVRLASVKLMMDMGSHGRHGAAPVTVVPVDAIHYKISEAYFSMAGDWTIVVAAEYQGETHEIAIPITVVK